MRLEVDRVPAAAAEIAAMVHADQREYLSRNQMWCRGEDDHQAILTLRVRAERLDEVVRRIGELGTVVQQDIGSRDVTDQFIDLEARLRNEKRVEIELLDLLEKRKDAPLSEILQLRQSLSNVRQSIERLTGTRDQLAHQVAFATLTVNLYPKGKQPQPPPQTDLGEHFNRSVSGGWEAAVWHLCDSLGWLIRILVGGLLWIALGVLLIALLIRVARRRT
jgi:hypothetical protein